MMKFDFNYCMRTTCKVCKRAVNCDKKAKYVPKPLTYRPFECLRGLWLELIKREKNHDT